MSRARRAGGTLPMTVTSGRSWMCAAMMILRSPSAFVSGAPSVAVPTLA